MKIGIELRQITLGIAGGISQLFKGVLETLFALYPDHEFVPFCTVYNRGLLESVPDHVKVLTLPTKKFFAEIDRIASEEGIEVLLRSYPVEDDLTFPLSKQIFFAPDIQHETFPQFFSPEALRTRRVAFNRTLARAGAFGTLTEYTRQTIRDYEWTRCQDIFLMSPALPVEHQHASSTELSPREQALIPPGDFFLYPANLWPHKNHRRVLQAFDLFLKQTGRPMSFVLTGHPDGWPELRAEFPDLPVHHLGFIRPQLLRLLFERAQALVFFSLYEGFGIPLLEAFDAGTPVICSNTTSLPEVGGEAVLTCDPLDIQAMSELMAQIVQDDAPRADLVAKGKKRLPLYSWERSAQNLFAACQRVARAADPGTAPILLTSTTDDLPLVSIVTPSYNQGRFLRRTIESVLNQTYPNIEYIVIDGGSTDESVDILRSYGDRLAWVSEPDRGQADATNKGFARSRGEIRAYLNSDDALLPDAVEKVVAYFQQNPDCDLVYGCAYYIDEQDQIIGMYKTADYSFTRLRQDKCICQPAAFWRTRIAEKVGPFNDQLNYVLDYEYWLRIDRAGGRIEHIYDVLASSRLYPEMKTSSARRRTREGYREKVQVCQAQWVARVADPGTAPILLTSTTDDLPLVSIVTPSYNQGRFLRRTVESVLNQTYPNIECIVIDGGSTDESVDILRSYGDRLAWVSEPDRGQADAINKGFARSRGEIRAYLNSDDALLPDAVEKVVAHFQQNPDCDLVYGCAYYIDEQDQITGMYKTADYSFARLMRDCCICQPAAFWRTRIAEKVGPFNDQLNYVLDYEYWLRIDRAGGRIEHIYDILASSRLYPGTKTLSARHRIYREIFQVCQAQGGYVHLDYFVGLWHHLIYEREDGWPRLLRRLPKSYHVMAQPHHKWHRLRHNSLRENVIYLGRRIKRRIFGRSPLPAHLAQPILYWVYRMSGRKPVYGFWVDNNWLGPACRIFLKNRTPGQELRLAGIAPVDMKLTAKIQGKTVGVYPLRAGQYETINFELEPASDQPLLLKFSEHVVGPNQRRLSFLLMDTNLFSEQDTIR